MVADAVIAGAGPNGLMLARELKLAGVQPVVLERLPEPRRENRANGSDTSEPPAAQLCSQ